jgi:outer membrane protein assembly factor BamB
MTDTDWFMYHNDSAHSGNPISSPLSSANVNRLGVGTPLTAASDRENFQTAPVISRGKVFIGSTVFDSTAPRLYRIDLATWDIEESYVLPPGSGSSVAGSPAVVGEWVYFTTLLGKVYCLNAFDFASGPRWVTDLVQRDIPKRQYVQEIGSAFCETSPLVVDGRVFVGTGRGEDGPTYGIVRCLDASTGIVQWLVCTCQVAADAPNQPNYIPPSLVTEFDVPLPFKVYSSDPPNKGASVWSSPAFDERNGVIVVGTGNPFPDMPAPAPPYAAGVIALDMSTGVLKGSFPSQPAESYRPADEDIDFGASPTIISTDTETIVGIGGKSGSYYLLRSPSLERWRSRQLLPYLHDDPAQPLPKAKIDNSTGDCGTLSAAAIYGQRRPSTARWASVTKLFVGVGLARIDSDSTPFIRALSFPSLDDAWPTAVGSDEIRRYTVPGSPLYGTPREKGLCSPTVVNDVVFMSATTASFSASPEPARAALYAFSADNGRLLWSTRTLPNIDQQSLAIGMAVSGDAVVFACQNQVFRCVPQPPEVTAGCPVAAVSADPGEIDLWYASTNGVIYSANYNDTRGTWAGWSALPGGVPGLPAGAPVMALARLPGLIDVFAAGDGGVVYTTAFADQQGTWNDWSALPSAVPGLPAGGAVTVIARQPGDGHWLDAWAAGSDTVYTASYNDTRGTWISWIAVPP